MAPRIPKNNSNSSTGTTTSNKVPARKSPDMIDTLITWLFRVITFPIKLITTIFNQLLTPGAAGSSFLGKCVFLFLVVLSSDSYWQMLFQGQALFPWWEETWTGWGWLPYLRFFPFSIDLGLFANPTIWLCIGVGMIIQCFQSACFNGERFAGQNARLIGLIAIGTWIFDLILTFVSRSPWRYSSPEQILGCLLFNIFTIGCAEWGRWGEKVLSGK
ncbi:MAG: hypothetical protein AAF757_00125 [Cyanobacteria bacterium P01_D01_bin.116]